MKRDSSLARLSDATRVWDVLVIGGGATGLGVAVDAASRGYATALVEQHDFAKGTSSRSTKLAHGGVRYLRSGEIGLVRGALRERGLLERNAPHLVHRRAFVIPIYRGIDLPLYGLGLKAYEWLSGRLSFGASHILSVAETVRRLPTVKRAGLRGGVLYFDGQFDDARLALALARTADDQGAAVANYVRVLRLLKEAGRIQSHSVRARVVVNATGIFTDEIRRLDDPAIAPMVTVSSGVHLTVDRSFLPGDHALMIPKTSDGRVLFAVPWQGSVILGTTDEPRAAAELEPAPLEQEIAFLLKHASKYLVTPVQRSDVRSVFTGLRPLVQHGRGTATKSLSRDHVVAVSPSGLLTITGGKWTSYRKMAEDAVTRAAEVGGLSPRASVTAELPLHGAKLPSAAAPPMIAPDPFLSDPIHPRLAAGRADVIQAVRHEMARTVEDFLSRRTRALQLDAAAALEAAPTVAELMRRELGRDAAWTLRQLEEFSAVAKNYLPA
jgi:glycerol-3-phosphate dehydrogenase